MNISTSEHKASSQLLARLDSLVGAADAYKNFRALALLGMTMVAAMLIASMFSFIGAKAGSFVLAGIGGLLAAIVVFYGLNAVGIMMMRDAQRQEGTKIMDAVLLSLVTSHRLFGVVVLQWLIMLAAVLAIAVVLFVCKIPGLGPVLFTAAFPLAAIFFGVLIFALFYVMLPLAGPAVWAGCTVFQVVARLNVIARKKLVSVILNQVLLMLLTGFCASIIFLVVTTGTMMSSALSASIIGFGGFNTTALIYGLGSGMGGSGHMAAGAIGGGLLFAIAAVIPMLIFTKGICIIYLNTTNDLDFAGAEAELESGLESVKKKAEEARVRARQLAEQQRGSTQPALATGASPSSLSSSPASACPACHAPALADDAFCGECGHKLK